LEAGNERAGENMEKPSIMNPVSCESNDETDIVKCHKYLDFR